VKFVINFLSTIANPKVYAMTTSVYSISCKDILTIITPCVYDVDIKTFCNWSQVNKTTYSQCKKIIKRKNVIKLRFEIGHFKDNSSDEYKMMKRFLDGKKVVKIQQKILKSNLRWFNENRTDSEDDNELMKLVPRMPNHQNVEWKYVGKELIDDELEEMKDEFLHIFEVTFTLLGVDKNNFKKAIDMWSSEYIEWGWTDLPYRLYCID
jgi:hypothetical protein